jgi:uncharacterized coiled-coil protein SlyX
MTLQGEHANVATGEAMAIAALMETIRAQTTTMERTNEKVDNLTGAMAKVREDIAVMKVRDESAATLAVKVAELAAEITAMKLRNAEQDGAVKLADVVRNYAPWLIALSAALIAFFKK